MHCTELFAVFKSSSRPNKYTLQGRQAMLHHHFDSLADKRDAITCFDSLNIIREEISSIDQKFESQIEMIQETVSNISNKRSRKGKLKTPKQEFKEQEKVHENDLDSEEKKSISDFISSEIMNRDRNKLYKEEVKSINMIVSKEINSSVYQTQRKSVRKEKARK